MRLAPCPGTLSNSETTGAARPRRRASRTTASASGCSLSRSTAATRRSRSSSSVSSAVTISTTLGSPRVRVPVLSKTTVSRCAACSSAIACLKRIPRFAPRPVPTMIAVGVASPSASGQVMTTTVIANSRASWAERPTTTYQTRKVARPPINATRTSQKAARSASRWPGAFEFWASWTSLTIWARAVSEPTARVRARSVPRPLIVAPIRRSPGSLASGMLSPVTMDSSTSLLPSTTSASTGTRAPGLTRTRSPTATSTVGTSTGSPSRMTTAIGGARSRSVRIASLAPPLARISNQCPSRTKTASSAAAS